MKQSNSDPQVVNYLKTMSATNIVVAEIPWTEVPKWLTNEFFTGIFEKILKKPCDQFHTRLLSIKPVLGVGESFISGLYRVVVESSQLDTEPKLHAFIVKYDLTPSEEQGIFQKEIVMYRDVVPALEREFKLFGDRVKFGPRCYVATADPLKMLIFDDLNANGYRVENRHIGLDMAHCEMFLSKLAKFHAASAVYQQKHKSFGVRFKSHYRENLQEWFSNFTTMSFPYFLDAVKSNSILRRYTDKIAAWPENLLAEFIRVTQANTNGFNVLNHGDAWVNNYLFAYDRNHQVNDILFIDYQVSYWASPAIDLFYFFITSPQNDIKAHEYDTLICHYHTELEDNLTKLRYKNKIPTLKELHIDLMDKGNFGAMLCYTLLPLILLDPRDDARTEVLMTDSEEANVVRHAMFNTPRFIRALEILLPLFDKKGLLKM